MSVKISPTLDHNIGDAVGENTLGNGARFWAYISPQNNTSTAVTEWSVTVKQDGQTNWSGTITSANPTEQLQTPNLSGVFWVTVSASGPGFSTTFLAPLPESKPNIGCNSNCAAMIGIVADENGKGAKYWTVWDALCSGM